MATAELSEILEDPTGGDNDLEYASERGSVGGNSTKHKRPRKRRNSGGSPDPSQTAPPSQISGEGQGEDWGGRVRARQQTDGQENSKDATPILDHQARFYKDYRKVANEYDKEFLKKYEEDLDTTLIFAGLFSAVTTAFIVQVDSKLRSDPGDETAALLRVLIYKVDNTTFGHDVPALPHWTGPPTTMVHVQAILFASLAVSLFSAFLAMLGKQWLNRYTATDMRGSAIERSRSRQRKLDGIVAWYFNHVLELLPLMLQAALLLLGCALSRYLWGTSIAVACVVLGVTSFGALLYIFIVVAGATTQSCPYQTPGSPILRYLWQTGSSALGNVFKEPMIITFVKGAWRFRIHLSRNLFLRYLAFAIRRGLTLDALRLWRAATRASTALIIRAHRLFRRAYTWLRKKRAPTARDLDLQRAKLDLRCISWTLQTSLEKPVHLSHPGIPPNNRTFDPALVTESFNIFVGCIGFRFEKVTIMEGSERLATLSAGCLFRYFHLLSATESTSGVLVDLRRRYNQVFPDAIDLEGLPFHSILIIIQSMLHRNWLPRVVDWIHYRLSSQEYIPLARHMVEIAQTRRRSRLGKVPRWILRFALHTLSLDPPPPPSVLVDCLKVIAIDLGCRVSKITTLNDSAKVEQISIVIYHKLETLVEAGDPRVIHSKHKPINGLVPYAIRLAQGGQQAGMVDLIMRASGASRSNNDQTRLWDRIDPYISHIFDDSSPPSSNQAIILVSPYVLWNFQPYAESAVTARWVAAVSTVPCGGGEFVPSVVQKLLEIAADDSLRSCIPLNVWEWLKERPTLPPYCPGRRSGELQDVADHIRKLEEIEVLTSYFSLVWSEWETVPSWCLSSVRKDFDGIGVWGNRQDLVERLDHILGQLGRGLRYLEQHDARIDEDHVQQRRKRYGELKEELLEVDRGAMDTLTQSYSTFACALPLL